jgi:hypothetical protein
MGLVNAAATAQPNDDSSARQAATGLPGLVVSYLTLRTLVGLLGVLLPILLVVGWPLLSGGLQIKPSISDYYDTPMRDVFVGVLFAIGSFLFSYNGYDDDGIAGKCASFAAIGVALFPATSQTRGVPAAHFVFAAILFLTLSYFSLVLFTRSKGEQTPEKKLRNRVFVVCGVVMLASIALIAIDHLVPILDEPLYEAIEKGKPVLVLETLALWSFGISWAVKGEALLADPETTEARRRSRSRMAQQR